jgi:type IV pilus assembly protein PilC
MPDYTCRVVDDSGRVSVRSLSARSPKECRSRLEAEGRLVLAVRRDWRRPWLVRLELGRKIKDRDIILFNQEFLALLRAGYPILRSLEAIAARVRNVHLQDILNKAAEDIRLGKSLSEAFRPHEKHFLAVYTASLLAGERSGNLPETVSRYIKYLKTVSETRSRIRSAMIYPTLILLFGLFMMALLLNFVLPRFADFYLSFEAELPWLSRSVMSLAVFLNRHWYLPAGLIVIAAVAFTRLRKRADFRVRLDALKLRVPFGRKIWAESAVSFFSRTLGLLLEAGIPLLQASGIAISAVPNASLLSRLRGLPDSIKNGQGLADSLQATGVFPSMALDMIRIGENSANLTGMLADLADFFDERVRDRISTLVSLVEPVVLILMGVMVAGMLLSVYLPIFNIIRVAR